METSGYILLHRRILEKPVWTGSTAEQKAILITILLLANHKEKSWVWNGKKFKAKPGQFVSSLDKIAEIAGVTIQNVRTAINKFCKLDFLTNESTKTGRLITVVNWRVYQTEIKTDNKDTNIPTNKAPNKELTKHQQTANKQLTTTNNDKNDKNDNNILIYTQNDNLAKAIREFIKMRKTIKKPLTDRALKLLFGKLDDLGKNDTEKIEIINQSIMNCWQGVYELKNKGGAENGKPVPKTPANYGNQDQDYSEYN
ncbi:hypothetical protein [Sporomusa aerivorans]|uniref:hypothetical protein n=1 Tax=Sporomusa aerivorans TaxID=204936 RepID=UPI00352A0D2F